MTPLRRVEARIKAVEEKLIGKVKAAADGGSRRMLVIATRQLQEIEAVHESLRHAYRRLDALEEAAGIEAPAREGNFQRHLHVLVTEGMIKNQRLTLTQQVRAMDLRVGEKMEITLRPTDNPADDKTVLTEVMEQGKKLKCRGPINWFYKRAGTKPNTYVVLQETTPGQWILLPGSSADGMADARG